MKYYIKVILLKTGKCDYKIYRKRLLFDKLIVTYIDFDRTLYELKFLEERGNLSRF